MARVTLIVAIAFFIQSSDSGIAQFLSEDLVQLKASNSVTAVITFDNVSVSESAYQEMRKSSALAENRPQVAEKPPLSGEKIGGEILAGGVGGVVGAFVGTLPIAGVIMVIDEVTDRKLPLDRQSLDSVPIFPDFLAESAFIAYTFGSPIGVHFFGNEGDETGSFWATLGGSVLGEAFVVGSAWLLSRNSSPQVKRKYREYRLIGIVLAAPIGATIGFNLTRRYKSSQSANQMNPAGPPIYLDLVRVRF